MDDKHGVAFEFWTKFAQVFADLVAVASVVHHDEQHRLLAQSLMLGVTLFPFLNAELQIVRVMLGENRARVLLQATAAGGIGQHRMLDDILVDRFHQRIVGNRLHEDRAVVVPGRGGHIHLQRQASVFL